MPELKGGTERHRVGDSEDESFGTAFFRDLRDRGLSGVQLVISDAHRGLVTAIATVFQGTSWQRCRVHFLRNALSRVRKGDAEMVAAAIGTIFAQPTPSAVRSQLEEVAGLLEEKFTAVAQLLITAASDITAFADFPQAHWRKIWSTNPLERLNKEIKRRTDVVGIFPNREALFRLTGAVLIESHDEWAAADRRYLSQETMESIVKLTVATVSSGKSNEEVEDTPALTTA